MGFRGGYLVGALEFRGLRVYGFRGLGLFGVDI